MSLREKAKSVLEDLNILELFEFRVEEFPYRKFYYDYDDLKVVNKSGYVKHYLSEVERRGEKPNQDIITKLSTLDFEFSQETKEIDWSLFCFYKIFRSKFLHNLYYINDLILYKRSYII